MAYYEYATGFVLQRGCRVKADDTALQRGDSEAARPVKNAPLAK